ncbi:OadG family protein [Magnetococcales bacterium HHB-1]
MPLQDALFKGLNLLILGMGTVYLFLAVLVISVGWMSRFSQWIGKKFPTETEPAPSPRLTTDNDILAVISAAVHRYRQR